MKATYNAGKTETRVIQISPATITLEVSPEFATLLAQMYGRIGGSPTTSLRGEWADLANEVRRLVPNMDEVTTGLQNFNGTHLHDILS